MENYPRLLVSLIMRLNETMARGNEGDIPAPDAKVKTYVIPTNEGYMMNCTPLVRQYGILK
jgi:acetate kinase